MTRFRVTTDITIAGEIRESYSPLAHVADEAVETLRRTDPDVRPGKRTSPDRRRIQV